MTAFKNWTLLSVSLIITSVFAQEIKTEELYKLKENEHLIHMDEHRICLTGEANGYILFVERFEGSDTNHYMILNGNEHGPYDRIYDPEISDGYDENPFYHFVFHQGEDRYLNWNGKIFGPYWELGPAGGWYHFISHGEDNLLFTFVRDSQEWVNVRGKEYGPYDQVMDYYTTYHRDLKIDDKGNHMFQYKKNDQHYFNINGKDIGPMDDFKAWGNYSATFFSKGFYSFKYKSQGKEYCVINGEVFGPFDEIISVKSSVVSGEYGVSYKKDGKGYYNRNGKEFGPFENIGKMEIGSHFSVIYTKNGKDYYQVDDKTYGPFENIDNYKVWQDGVPTFTSGTTGNIWVHMGDYKLGPYRKFHSYYPKRTEDGGLAFKYGRNDVYGIYVYANGRTFGPIKSDYIDMRLKDSKACAFDFQSPEDKKYYMNVCGKVYGPYDEAEGRLMYLKSKKKFAFKYKKEGAWYVRVKNKEYGPYPKGAYVFDVQGKPWFRAEDETGHYLFTGKKIYGPYKYVWYKNDEDKEAGKWYMSVENGRFMTVDGKPVEVEVPPSNYASSDDDGWRKVDGPTNEDYLKYNEKSGQMDYKGTVYEEAAKNTFGYQYADSLGIYHWMSLDSNIIYSHKLKGNF